MVDGAAVLLLRRSSKSIINRRVKINIYCVLISVILFAGVAEAMVDPYGDDDADFELNFLLDRHAQVIVLVSC